MLSSTWQKSRLQKNPRGQVSYDELTQGSTSQEFGLTQIEAVQKICSLIDNSLLLPVDCSTTCFVMFTTRRDISEFERKQKRLQEAWLAANEIATSAVLREEAIELKRHENSHSLWSFGAKMPTHEMNISGIKIGKRFREDVGDVFSLANSIKDIGLLHPVVVTHEYELIAGYRRIAAFKKLGCI